MRPKSLRWRHRTLRVALAVSWASSMQFAGCLNNPTRTDLAGEAGKAALRAEQDITEQKTEVAMPATGQTSRTEAGGIVQAGGEQPDTDSPILRTGGEEPAPKKPSFWSFLNPKPSEPAVKDPFADHPELKTPDKSKGATTPAGKARLASSSVSQPDTDKPKKDPYSAENWFEKEFAKQPGLSDWEKKAIAGSDAAAAQGDLPAAAVKLNDKPRSTPVASAKSEESPWAAEQPAEKSASASVKLPEKSAAPTAPAFKQQERKLLPAASAEQPQKIDAIATRQQKLRIQALLSEAHTSSLRGELHAAYRSALLAEKVANEHQIQFAEGEENPHEFARTIATKIWRTSNTSEETYLAATEAAAATQPEFPASSTASTPAKSHSPFTDETFATWEPLTDKVDQRPARSAASIANLSAPSVPATAISQPAVPAIADVLPEIRPWGNDKPPRELSRLETTKAPLSAPSLSSSPEFKPGHESKPESNTGKGADPGVQFAIAHTLSEDQSPQLIDPFARPGSERLPEFSGHFGKSDQDKRTMASATLDTQRPLLMAPPIPADDRQQVAEKATLSWDELSHSKVSARNSDHSRTADAKFKWRVTWSILGLIGAAIATVIGVRISRSEYIGFDDHLVAESDAAAAKAAPGTAPASTTALEILNAASPEEPEIQPLQFKRAA